MNISFGQKIPIAKCTVKDTYTNQKTDGYISELDCKDTSDILRISSLPDTWEFQETISLNMKDKYSAHKNGRDNQTKFYILENENGEILGISCIDDRPKSLEVRFIESRDDHRYKFVGQNLLATLAKQVLDSRQQKLIIRSSISSAYDFYEKICGFKPAKFCDLEMIRQDIPSFIRRTNEKIEKETESLTINEKA